MGFYFINSPSALVLYMDSGLCADKTVSQLSALHQLYPEIYGYYQKKINQNLHRLRY